MSDAFEQLSALVGSTEQSFSNLSLNLRKIVHSPNIRYNHINLDQALWARHKEIGALIGRLETVDHLLVSLIRQLGISPVDPIQPQEEEPYSLHQLCQKLLETARQSGAGGETAYSEVCSFLRQSPTGRLVIEESERGIVHGE